MVSCTHKITERVTTRENERRTAWRIRFPAESDPDGRGEQRHVVVQTRQRRHLAVELLSNRRTKSRLKSSAYRTAVPALDTISSTTDMCSEIRRYSSSGTAGARCSPRSSAPPAWTCAYGMGM